MTREDAREDASNTRSARLVDLATIGQVANPAPVCATPKHHKRPSLRLSLDPRPVVECLDCGNRYRWTPRPDICLCGAPLHDGWRSLPLILWDRFLSILPANSGRREW